MKLYIQRKTKLICLILLFITVKQAGSQTIVLENQMVPLRIGNHPEWLNFSNAPQRELKIVFECTQNPTQKTLSLRQEDVKQKWLLQLNGKELGNLNIDENPMITYWAVPPDCLNNGQNSLLIEPADTTIDDIRIGNISLIDQPLLQLLSQGKVEISVTDGDNGYLVPARITVVGKDGALQPLAAPTDRYLATRTGCIYTGTGKVTFGLPAGVYTIYANHGFEYGVDSVKIVVKSGEILSKKLVISREVSTEGWISTDTHIHTNYYAGDGDATLMERAITIAGEGIELPVLTDHNVKSNLDSIANLLGMKKYYTPIVGFEYTTPLGHFNVFPVTIHTPVPDNHVKSWNDVADNLQKSDKPEITILNHALDNHNNFRPFDSKYHISCAGTDLRDWKFPAIAMEVINSSAQLTDYMRLYEEWFGMMNRGYNLTPVGASDSHTVSRYLVGQGRTYIKTKDTNPDKIEIKEAVKNFKDGKVMVSFGLLTEMVVDTKYGPGELVPSTSKELMVSVRVMGPGWTTANRIVLYANGIKIREDAILNGSGPGIKYFKTWKIPRPKYDVFLVAIAEGPGGNKPFWPVPKPYQNTSSSWIPRVFGSTGAIWIDGDGDGQHTSAYMYARKLIEVSKGNISNLIEKLTSYDAAVAIQVAAILQEQGDILSSPEVSKAIKKSTPMTKSGFKKFIAEYKISKTSR
ncbi:PHP domain protein [Aquipluma nitroreducens]|uniref:PHP domain protein n=1 Tax=Aquipluma nitroreducens TaxID=2010828 RepID=A0A5K7S488_9BACT|nr:CehA/McbA family metallohydrolase [Aquipluma nitroreducens]BBE16336.1 PHP domain protein [Aquipluma nitroreducens]